MTIPWALIIKLAVQAFVFLWPLIVEWWKSKHPATSIDPKGVAKAVFTRGDAIEALATGEMPLPESPADLVAKLRAKLDDMIKEAPLRHRPALRLLHWAAPHMGNHLWEQLHVRSLVGPSVAALAPEAEGGFEDPTAVLAEVKADVDADAAPAPDAPAAPPAA